MAINGERNFPAYVDVLKTPIKKGLFSGFVIDIAHYVLFGINIPIPIPHTHIEINII